MERDRRQREVIQGLLDGVKNLPLTKYPNLINTVLPYIKTNMNPTKILGLGATVLDFGNFNIKQIEFPIDDDLNTVRVENMELLVGFLQYDSRIH